jgi:ubiquinone/menaquinone biosynthesis C-methylase UbiE
MGRRTDYERMAAAYDAGRALPLDQLDAWRVVLSRYVAGSGRPVLDLGSGTGLFSEALATWFDVVVVGVEPSEAMRREAATRRRLPNIIYVAGRAEWIPLEDGSCGCAWLSTVLHHITDLPACARELRRVLRDGDPVLIRNSFGDRLDDVHWLDFFPPAKRLAATRWPTVEQAAHAFSSAGFEVETLESVPEVIAPNLRAYHDRLRVRANSTLTLIDEHEFAEGLARLDRAASEQSGPEPVVDRRDLLVLR